MSDCPWGPLDGINSDVGLAVSLFAASSDSDAC
jgi:hypothetical protein